MKVSNIVTYAVIAGVLIYLNWGSNSPSGNNSSNVNNNSQSSQIDDGSAIRPTGSPYSLRSTENSWPAISESSEAIAANLLASNYYIVLDGSGSMSERKCSGNQTKLQVAKSALEAFSQSIPNEANIGLFIFDESGQSERVELGKNNKARFSKAIYKAKAKFGTPLKSAIQAGYSALEKQAKNQLGYGEYHLVVVTDGQASSQAESPSRFMNLMLEDSPVVVHTIGFCISEHHSLNQPGRTYYRKANDAQSLQRGLSEVLAEAPDFNVGSFSTN